MTTIAAVGSSLNAHAARAAEEALEAARGELACRATAAGQAAPEIDFLLMLCSAAHDVGAALEAVRARCSAPVGGCTAEGLILPQGSTEGTFWLAIMAISSPKLRFRPILVPSIGTRPQQAVEAIGQLVDAERRGPNSVLLLFPDGMCPDTPGFLDLLEKRLGGETLLGASEGASTRSLPESERTMIVGGAAGDMLRFETTHQFCNDTLISDGAFALFVDGPFELFIEVSHGCTPLGIEHVVTSAHGAHVRSIDQQPAWTLLRDYLDDDLQDTEGLPLLTVAAHLGDGDWVVRSPHRVLSASNEVLFAAGLPEGTRFQMTRRTPMSIRDSARACASSLCERAGHRRPSLVLQFDCAYRGRLLLGERTDQYILEPLLSQLGRDVPWLGMFTYGEIAPLARATRLHNDSLVLCAFFDVEEG